MRRRNWLIATMAALFVLQAPLCAIACLESSEGATAAGTQQDHPCHEGNEESRPSDAPHQHDDCGCEFLSEVLLPGIDASLCPSNQAVLSPHVLLVQQNARVSFVPSVPARTDLPPPDILLLKSTLII
jgi:hypothetical protein